MRITRLLLEKVRHIKNVGIPISEGEERRHLLLTGKNGSGKTSALNALAAYLDDLFQSEGGSEKDAAVDFFKAITDARIERGEAWSPIADGLCVCGSGDETLRVWDLRTGAFLRMLRGHVYSVNCIAVTEDGLCVSGSEEGTLRVWNLRTGACLRILEGHSYSVNCVAVTKDGLCVSGSTDRTLRVWNLRTGAYLRILVGHSYSVNCVAVTEDGLCVSGSGDKTLRVWDLRTGACLRTLKGHSSMVRCVAVTEDGLCVSGSADGTLRVWDLRTGACLRTLKGHSSMVRCVAVTEDGLCVSGSDDRTLRVWDLRTGACLRILEGHSDSVNCVAVTKDGLCVSGSDDRTLRVWNLRTGACLRTQESVGRGGLTVACLAETEPKNGSVLAAFSCHPEHIREEYWAGRFILAYFRDNRIFDAEVSGHVEKVPLKEHYAIQDEPRKSFIKYLVDKKVSQSLYQMQNDTEKAQKLQAWFDSFEELLREIFEEPGVTLDFDVETFRFTIKEPKREDFDFNTMSAGYAAILDIAVGIIMRMEAHTGGTFEFDMPGIVLIDELETHLHYELQRKVLPFLCRVFPNIQFIVTTHSAFILNSIENAVIYDLENQTLVPNGLNDIPYDGIIKGYFGAPTLSEELRTKFERYKELVKKAPLTDEDLTEISRLQLYLDEIPDYLALGLTTEYERLKLEFESREDL